MAGYDRQSAADIVPTAVVRSGPVNNELNALRDAFVVATGHKHDGTATEGAYIPLIGDADAKNKVSIDTNNNRVGMFVEVATVSTEQVRVQDGAIIPVTDDDIDLGSSSFEFRNLFIDGTATVDSLVADTADINGGTIDAAVIGAASAAAITGTLITATTGFSGPITGAVTGNVTGNLTGNVTGNVTGNLTGNVTASSGTSTFNNVTISGTLDMDGATSATIINLASPTNTGDAATKGYVDTADALKLNLSGGTMSGAIAMGTNKITGLGTPTATADAATKGYVDTADALKLNLSGGTMSGAIAMGTNKITGLGTPTDSADAATKGYVDTQVSNLIDSAPGALDTLNELAAALGDDANFSTTVTNSLATKLNLSGGTMTGAIAMGTNKITGMGDPTSNQDAATKIYVDTQRDTRLALAGGTMSGNIEMNSNKITGLAAPTNANDAVRKTYVDTADNLKLNLTGGTMTGAIAMGTNKITGLGDPTNTQDAATKTYVDTQRDTRLALAGGTMTGAIAMGTNRITGLGDPVGNQDAATKYYIDTLFGSTTSAAASAAAAAISESNAANSEANALTYSNNASSSASAAATSASNAATAYDNFDDRYLGSKSSPPSLDNDGNALLTGALYWNSSGNQLYVWDGAAWDPAAFNISGGLTTGDIGVTVQGYDAGLQSIAGLTTAADRMIYTTAADTYAVTTLTSAGRAILDDADAAAQRTTLGLGSLATLNSVDLASNVTGDLPFANLAQGSALSVLGVTGNATADNASIAANTDHQVLRRSGTSVAFGAVNLAQSAAVTGTLAVTNGGTGITSFGTGVATWLGTPSSANLAAAVTDETGTGSLVFSASPTFTGTVTTAAISMADNLLTRPVLKDYAVEGSAVGNTGSTETFDLVNANFFSATLDQACTFTFSNPPASGDFGTFVLELTNGGAFAITWPASVDWPGGTAPTLTAAGKDQLVFTTRDAGTTWFGFVAGLDIK